jgi:transposase
VATPAAACALALRGLAQRIQHLDAEAEALAGHLDTLTATTPPRCALGSGWVPTAPRPADRRRRQPHPPWQRGRLRRTVRRQPGAGVLGQTTGRHRLNRGGNRQANAALHRIVLTRLAHHHPTRAYAQRRTAQGKTRREIIRCLKRYLARELFPLLAQLTQPTSVA